MINDEASRLKVDLSKLETLHGYNNAGNILLVGNRRTGVEILVVWLPVVVAIASTAWILPFISTNWGVTNLIAIVQVFGLVWILLTGFTWAQGTTRHFYLWDVEHQSITHINTGETKPMDLTINVDDEGIPKLELLDPLASGWHLETPPGSMVAATVEQCGDIAEWKPPGVFSHLSRSLLDGSLIAMYFVANVFLIPIAFGAMTLEFFLWCQATYLGAWLVGQVVAWLLDLREFKQFTVGEMVL